MEQIDKEMLENSESVEKKMKQMDKGINQCIERIPTCEQESHIAFKTCVEIFPRKIKFE